MTDGPGWARAVGCALTGECLPLVVDAVAPDVDTALGALAEAGWDRDRIAALAAARHAEHLPWPFPVPGELRTEVGAAALHSLVGRARDRLGVDRPDVRTVARRRLDADERRLMVDVPPHHGRSG